MSTGEKRTHTLTPFDAPPPMPEFRRAQRARVILQLALEEAGEVCAEEGWARLDGPWLHWLSDEDDEWRSWPAQSVICIDWRGSGRV
jgi:hypothetical protein